jgi:hypothetical protein
LHNEFLGLPLQRGVLLLHHAPTLAVFPSFLSGHSDFLCPGLLQPEQMIGFPSPLLLEGGTFFRLTSLLPPLGLRLQLCQLEADNRLGFKAAKSAHSRRFEPLDV